MGVHYRGPSTQLLNIAQFLKVKYFGNFIKDGLNVSQYMEATYESINNRFCSVAEIK